MTGLGDVWQTLKDIKNGLEVNAAALALAGSRNAAGTRISRIDTPITAHTSDMYGKIIYQDDFEPRDSATINWTSGGANPGANNSTRYTTLGGKMWRGGGCLLIETTATTPVAAHVASSTKYLSMRAAKKVQVELMFNLGQNAYLDYIEFRPLFHTGAVNNQPTIRYDVANTGWEYLDTAAAQAAFGGALATQALDTNGWHYLRYSFDFDAGTFLDVQCDEDKIDARSISFRAPANVANQYSQFQIGIKNVGSNQSSAYVDDVLITDITESV